MIIEKKDVMELEQNEYENSKLKNSFIAGTKGDFLVFLDKSVTKADEILSLMKELDYLRQEDAVVFGEGVPEGKAGLLEFLNNCSMRIFGFVLKRRVFERTGCFNEGISAETNFELLCRIAEVTDIYCIPCQAEETSLQCSPESREKALTYAYIMKRYMLKLKEQGMMENVFQKISAHMLQDKCLDAFNVSMAQMLEKEGIYEKIAENTAPFFIISGDDTCYGVLRDFASSLAKELTGLGQAVLTSDGRYGAFNGYEELEGWIFKGIIGFQAPALEKDFFKRIRGKKFQFWFDNPVFFDDMFQNLSDDYYILCQDGYYADFIRKHYQVKNAVHFPPGGKDGGYSANQERPYDIVFIGTYNPAEENFIQDVFQQEFYDFMINHPSETFESGLKSVLERKKLYVDEQEFLQLLRSMGNVFRNVIYYYRKQVVETIIASGFSVHVFGDSWNRYESDHKSKLVIHPAVSVEDSLKILGQSKIGLNVMTWHKAGMTERIANIMLSGAVCLSDETVYLTENFHEGEEIVLFSLESLEEIPEKIDRLLKNEKYRRDISQKAYCRAGRHTWRARAEQLLEII